MDVIHICTSVALRLFPLNATSTDLMIFPFPHKFREPTEHPAFDRSKNRGLLLIDEAQVLADKRQKTG
jgi:hypothetical protein